MPKTCVSPVKYFSGHVVLTDPIPLPQVGIFERSIADSRALVAPTLAEVQAAAVPGILACVDEWHLAHLSKEQLSPDNWPGTPREASAALIQWLVSEIMLVYRGELEIPND